MLKDAEYIQVHLTIVKLDRWIFITERQVRPYI